VLILTTFWRTRVEKGRCEFWIVDLKKRILKWSLRESDLALLAVLGKFMAARCVCFVCVQGGCTSSLSVVVCRQNSTYFLCGWTKRESFF